MNPGARQPVATAAVGLLLLLSLPATAQQEGARCDALATDAGRLACFRNVVRELEERMADRATASAAEDSRATSTPAETAREPVPDRSGSPSEISGAAGSDVATGPVERVDRVSATGSGSDSPLAVASTAGTATPSSRPAVVPEERASDEPPRPQADRYEIVRITTGPLGNLTVRLANGEVWRQLDSDNTRVLLPGDRGPQYAVIEEGFLGSRRMKIVGTARSFRVRRID